MICGGIDIAGGTGGLPGRPGEGGEFLFVFPTLLTMFF